VTTSYEEYREKAGSVRVPGEKKGKGVHEGTVRQTSRSWPAEKCSWTKRGKNVRRKKAKFGVQNTMGWWKRVIGRGKVFERGKPVSWGKKNGGLTGGGGVFSGTGVTRTHGKGTPGAIVKGAGA